jgi:Subunit 11 of the general transcription factor TFIIH
LRIASLQIPYLLNVAFLTSSMIPSFAPAPNSTFKLLNKLDLCFASLLSGINLETNEALSGFGLGGSATAASRTVVSVTEKVRLKSLVDKTRMVVVKTMESIASLAPDDEDADEGFLIVEGDDDADSMEEDDGSIYGL